MAKSKSLYICSVCGYESPKWFGCCPGCREWNTMNEEIVSQTAAAKSKTSRPVQSLRLDEINSESGTRYQTGMKELDRVLGGGLVKGSLVLLSGDPGIGKSTILLQVCQYLSRDLEILYISGEESAHQIKLRAHRLGVDNPKLRIMSETDVLSIVDYIRTEKPDVVIVDSIQTMDYADVSSSPGSVTQVRESASVFMRTAKTLGIPILLVGHVNKDGNIAGPKVLEHIVDAVLYFEGNRNFSYRILRAVKNRYGSTNEIGVFEMLDKGLMEVENPSLMLISGKPKNTPGSCIACAMEGSRPILAEVQALVAPTGFGNPRRMPTVFDYNRTAMLLAVLEKRSGYFFGNMDTYVNIVGGLKLDEPATDLSVAMALVSSLKDAVVSDDTLAFGEIGLAGEIRGVSNCEQRVREAVRLGFSRCIIPHHNLKTLSASIAGDTEIIGVRNIREAFEAVTR
ncbi:MAG TPA: DNA repair protein RadA [Ruminococcaceae bacterium]|nr:DNA repair protein RadA [Oscillospiraceae bacterium]